MNTPVTGLGNTYINQLIKPYTDAIDTIDNLDVFMQWVEQIIPEDLEKITSIDLVEAKYNFIYYLKTELFAYICEVKNWAFDGFVDADAKIVTPWNLSRYRNEKLARLLGPATNELPVTVVVGDKAFQHMMSEELALGILLSVDDRAQLFMYNIPLTSDFLSASYEDPLLFYPERASYKAFIINRNYWFTSPDLIQGIKTGSEWFGEDPHAIVSELTLINDNDTETPITF